MTHDYDVAFSYAGEQKSYVYQLYESLKSHNISIFYYEGELAKMWGKDLYQYLNDIYLNKAKYCVLFLSQNYANKLWTKHELKVVQARAFKEAEEYILPIRFDQTEIPGLLPTIAYIESVDYTIEEISDLILEKIKGAEYKNSSSHKANNKVLEIALADAVIWAEQYLQPQPLNLSDKIAEAVRNSFFNSEIIPNIEIIKPYILNEKASYRVVGYLAYQIKPFSNQQIILDFLSSLKIEKQEAIKNKETRPLWQLLVCIELLSELDNDVSILIESLSMFLNFMEENQSIDLGGECKDRIRYLIEMYT
ncbi:toll/interleukin-1 receptor domain-containing protein [Ulvibacterium sp.]|uniref:toll/interleukin-1 receptor domain-containing protein n=1 Tax=Ulvibacterium sp. TaxID=2665914 RepID=UPI003BAD702E